MGERTPRLLSLLAVRAAWRPARPISAEAEWLSAAGECAAARRRACAPVQSPISSSPRRAPFAWPVWWSSHPGLDLWVSLSKFSIDPITMFHSNWIYAVAAAPIADARARHRE